MEGKCTGMKFSAKTGLLAPLLLLFILCASCTGETGISLFKAAKNGALDTAALLIKKGCDINTRDHENESALIDAIRARHFDLAEFPVNKGAQVNTRDDRGDTPLKCAIESGNAALAGLLRERGATE